MLVPAFWAFHINRLLPFHGQRRTVHKPCDWGCSVAHLPRHRARLPNLDRMSKCEVSLLCMT